MLEKLPQAGNTQKEQYSTNPSKPRVSKRANISKYVRSHKTLDSSAQNGRTPVSPIKDETSKGEDASKDIDYDDDDYDDDSYPYAYLNSR